MRLRRTWCVLMTWTAIGFAAGPFPDEWKPPSVGIVLTWEYQPAEDFLKLLRREVEHIFRPSGLTLRWELSRRRQSGVYDRVVVVKLQGRCSAQRVSDFRDGSLVNGSPLGRTYVMDGEVIPHAEVDCDQVARALAEMRARLASHLLIANLHARLAGRVLGHEMMHILLETREHDAADFTRASLRLEDLQVGARLRPAQIAALQRIGKGTSGISLAGR
jgi:hypothetical protein